MPDRADAATLRERLVPWYRAVARDLPWRREVTPYRVLLSELMLQQTRVDTVIPYFERFVARWPRLEDLAAASDEEVLSAWSGLGYYRRARNLLAIARAAAARGGLPHTPEALRALPGIGPYTAGAIASIAYGAPAAAVDGNVERVISRLDALEALPRSKAGRLAITARVEAIQAPGVASEVTQGLMELGATVCAPRSPRCDRCPWADLCVARRDGRIDALPRLPPRARPVEVTGVAGLLVRHGRVLLGRRPPGLLGGLWEPISAEHPPVDPPEPALRRAFAQRVGLEVRAARPVGEVIHVFTHRRLLLRVFEVEAAGEPRGDDSYEALAWADPVAPALAVSTLARKVLGRLPRVCVPLAADGPGPSRVLSEQEEGR